MPDGIVQWFDEGTGEGRLISGSRRYACWADEMHPSTRSAGCHVHFDIDRDGATAVSVVSRPHRRGQREARIPRGVVGRVAVASRRGGALTAAEDDLRRVVKPKPIHLARWWATAVSAGGIDEALAMYSPTIVVTIDGHPVEGRSHLRTALEQLPVFGSDRLADSVRGDLDEVVVIWAETPESPSIEARMRFDHEEVVSQTIDQLSENTEPIVHLTGEFPIQIVSRGRVGWQSEERATEKVLGVVGLAGAPVLFARIKITQHPDPAAFRPAKAEAALDVNGHIVRAGSEADVMADAIDQLEGRLVERLRHHREHRSWVRPTAVAPEAGEWRHGNLPTERPRFFDRPIDEREIVRHATWSGGDVTVDEAAFDLEMLDHEFHLFHELLTGQDSLIIRSERLTSRAEPGVYLLQQLRPDPEAVEHTAVTVELDPATPPTLSLDEATEALNLGGDSFVYYRDRTTGHGNVLYRRLDGHYGLVTPEPHAVDLPDRREMEVGA